MEEILDNQVVVAEEKVEKKEPIVGVHILRFYMAFMVVAAHLGGTLLLKWAGLFYIFQPFHVPTFMLLSFLLCGRYFLMPTKELVRKRLLRIIIPFVTWGIVAFFLNLILWSVSFSALINQLFTGFPLNNPLWYLASTLWISIFFWIFRLLTKNKWAFIIVISAISVFCIVLQYTGLNYSLFNNLPYNIKFTVGRSFEMIPYATIGILLSMVLPYLEKLDKKWHIVMFIGTGALLAGLILLRNFVIPYRPKGFDFPGISLIIGACLLVLTAFTNPLNLIASKTFKSIIKWVTSFTLGIYCMHVVIGLFVEWFFITFNWDTYNTLMVLTTYVICYLISFLIWLIPNKYVRQTVN